MGRRYSEFEALDRAMLPLLRTAEDGAAALPALPPKRIFGSGSAAVVRRGARALTPAAPGHARGSGAPPADRLADGPGEG